LTYKEHPCDIIPWAELTMGTAGTGARQGRQHTVLRPRDGERQRRPAFWVLAAGLLTQGVPGVVGDPFVAPFGLTKTH
jgi:hypothetical protein